MTDAPLKPIAAPDSVSPKGPAPMSGLPRALMIFGGAMAAVSLVVAVYFYIQDLPVTGTGPWQEYVSQAALFAFLGSFGFVPGILMFSAGRTLRREGASKALAWRVAAFAVPVIALMVFLLWQGGWLWAGLSAGLALAMILLARYVHKGASR